MKYSSFKVCKHTHFNFNTSNDLNVKNSRVRLHDFNFVNSWNDSIRDFLLNSFIRDRELFIKQALYFLGHFLSMWNMMIKLNYVIVFKHLYARKFKEQNVAAVKWLTRHTCHVRIAGRVRIQALPRAVIFTLRNLISN
jgi:hypothetical protein